ncbi:MAG: TetR/AcrR family transcriptional regulator, partial [Desulfamplus sp.]|nr:TetR/AcrR family transcriptional regulator [Desulfamplus sp.]
YRLALVNDVCGSYLETTYNSLVDIFEQAVIIGKADGSIADVDSRKTALVIFSMLEGVVRFKIYNLYDTGALFNELIKSCNKILKYKE